MQSGVQFFTTFVCVERQQCIWANKVSWLKVKEPGTHCSSPHLSCLHSHSGCHTSSGLGCSCYSRSEIHEVRRSFHLFHQEQTNMKMKMASKSMNINIVLAIIFSTCNHSFLRVFLSKTDTEFKTRYVLRRLTCHKMKYLTVLPITPQQNLWQEVAKRELSSRNYPRKCTNTAQKELDFFGLVTYWIQSVCLFLLVLTSTTRRYDSEAVIY